jgi:hypothetical protein
MVMVNPPDGGPLMTSDVEMTGESYVKLFIFVPELASFESRKRMDFSLPLPFTAPHFTCVSVTHEVVKQFESPIEMVGVRSVFAKLNPASVTKDPCVLGMFRAREFVTAGASKVKLST